MERQSSARVRSVEIIGNRRNRSPAHASQATGFQYEYQMDHSRVHESAAGALRPFHDGAGYQRPLIPETRDVRGLCSRGDQ